MDQSILNRTRNDKFVFLFGLPAIFKSLTDEVLKGDLHDDKIELSVFELSTPPINIPSISLGYGGQTYKTSSFSRPDYGSLDVKFFLDNGYQNYYILWKWLNLFNDAQESTSNILTPDSIPVERDRPLRNPLYDYTSTITLLTLDEYNNKLVSFQYTDAFITSLGAINYSHQGGTEIVCSASFAFNQFYTTLENNINKCLGKDCNENIVI